ncbi:MAG: ABC transporter permease [Acidimicrobiales bacterium]
MTIYIIKRLIAALIVVVGVTMITFGMLHIISSSPGRAVLGLRASPQAVAAFNKAHGYDKPIYVQYVRYVGQLVRGNLGYSYKEGQSVAALISENILRSAYLSGAAITLAILLSFPIGIWQAYRRNSISDYAVTGVAFTLYSMPSFFLGLLLIDFLALRLGWFPVQGAQQTNILAVIANIHAMFLPIITLTGVQMAAYSRYMRSSALDNLAQDYIRLARAKGLSERAVLVRHLFRNSSLAMITLIGLSIPALLAGNLITESLFNYPGLGFLFYTALQNEDYPVLLAITLMGAVAVVVGNLIADVAITVADPRVRL